MKITKTITKSIEVTKINLTEFPLSLAPNATKRFKMKNGVNIIKFKTIVKNPNAKRVYIVSLFDEDLINLIDDFGKRITKTDIKNNSFYVKDHQLM